MIDQNKTLEEQNSALLLDIQKLVDNHQEVLKKKEKQLIFGKRQILHTF